jgi:hypothetical protein
MAKVHTTLKRNFKINFNHKNQTAMKKFHPFFTIGTVGMILIAGLHIFLALGLSMTSVHHTFFVLYPVFLSFLIPGVILTIKKQQTLA